VETVETDRVELPEVVTDVGLKLPVAPVGNPLTLKFTVPVKPAIALTVVVYVVPFPAVTVCEPGVAEMLKSGVGTAFTTSVTVVECVKLPLVPVIVIV
jgi:hypothetical protein